MAESFGNQLGDWIDPIKLSNPVSEATDWMIGHMAKRPQWRPSLNHLNQISKKFKITPKKALEIFDELNEARAKKMNKWRVRGRE